jgi:hypothetical protein
LDNILLMALRKEPLGRYVSVQQFSEDVHRHLDGVPVAARKSTFGYRARISRIKRNLSPDRNGHHKNARVRAVRLPISVRRLSGDPLGTMSAMSRSSRHKRAA